VLHNFDGKADGSYLAASVLQASNGDLVGGTEGGGNDDCAAPNGCGVIFLMSKKAASKAAAEDPERGSDRGNQTIISPPTNPLRLNWRRVAPY
jgi:hypothetical protein